MENFNSLHIITNNIKGMQNKSKHLSIIEYFKNKIGKNGNLFLLEIHSNISDEGKWKGIFSGPVSYSHGICNSCDVLITLFGINKICVNSQTTGKHGRILTLGVTIDEYEYNPINIHNANIESEQLKVLNDLSEPMKKVNITHEKQIVLAGDFNLFFDSNLEAKGGKPILKEKSVVRMIQLKKEYDSCDI